MKDLEPFVDADAAANFLSVTRRRILEMARASEIPAYPIGHGERKMWRFRLSELAAAISRKRPENATRNRVMIARAVP